ncbi:MAG: HIT domain-containing protein [Patescibacteria group bacterium]|nr:HIT domain-containing protein [Patescibacteria group bacterium]
MSKQKKDKQKYMKNARTNGDYAHIWQHTGKCVFCDLKEKYILLEENNIVLTINIYPYIDGQLMAIPREHISSPKELNSKQWETIRKFSYLAKKLIRKTHGHKGMWTLIREGGEKAQMSVTDHLHVHFIPFDEADLCQWNYRELKNTPVKNAQEYKNQAKYIKKLIKRYNKKYQEK